MAINRSIRDNTVIGISGYNDVKGLSKLVEQTHNHVRQIIYVDGVYDFFHLTPNGEIPSPARFSTDGSRELCAKYDNVTLIEYAGYQPDKRQKYVDKAAELNAQVLLVIDTDEWIHPDFTDWNLFYDKLEAEIEMYGRFHRIWNMMIYVEKGYELACNAVQRASWSIGSGRIWFKPEELEYYAGVHYYVRRKGTYDPYERLMSTNKTISEGIRLTTNTELRSPEFKQARETWAKKGMDYEERLINQYNSLVANMNAHNRFLIQQARLYPLVCVLCDQDNPKREEGTIKSNDYVDIMFIKYDSTKTDHTTPMVKALEYFRKHAGYTHLVLTRFDINWSKREYDILYKCVKEQDYTVLSGYIMHLGNLIGETNFLSVEEAGFTLPNESKIRKGELHSHATEHDILTYTKLYRQDILAVDTVENLPLTFIRNDIVKFIGKIDPTEETDPSIALNNKLKKLGITQYVNLHCKLERINLNNWPLLEKPLKCELHIGKYGK